MSLTEAAVNTEELIAEALKKVNGQSEKDICRYLPAETEGYMHHFTLRKLKKTNPQEFESLIRKFILDVDSPETINPKPRIRRKKSLSIKQSDLNLILKLAQKTGDQYLLAKLGSKLSISQLKRELIKSIKENRVEEELWHSYVQAIESFALREVESQ